MISDARKAKFIEELAESGIIAVAAKRAGISRSTIYEWVATDHEFAEACDTAHERGRDNWCDFAENQLHSLVKQGDLPAIRYLLDNNSERYYKPRRPIDAPAKEPAPIYINVHLNRANKVKVDADRLPAPMDEIKRLPPPSQTK